GKLAPNSAAARIMTGIWMSPRLVDPRTFDRYTVDFVVGVSRMRFMNPKRLSWIVLMDPNMPTVNIEVARTPGSRNAMQLFVWKIVWTRAGEAQLKLLPKNASHMNGCTNVITSTHGFRNVRRSSRA